MALTVGGRLMFADRRTLGAWAAGVVALLVFGLVRMPLVSTDVGNSQMMPGEPYHMYRNWYTWGGFVLHVATATLMCVLAPLQFVPGVRRRCIRAHRAVGYTYLTLLFASIVGVAALTVDAAGNLLGSAGRLWLIPTNAWWLTTGVVALVRVRQHRIREHNMWMLRNIAAAFMIILIRVVVFATAGVIMTLPAGQRDRSIWSCDEIAASFGYNAPDAVVTACRSSPLPAASTFVAVEASADTLLNFASSLRVLFIPACWFSTGLTWLLMEVYIRRRYMLTRDEAAASVAAAASSAAAAAVSAVAVNDSERKTVELLESRPLFGSRS